MLEYRTSSVIFDFSQKFHNSVVPAVCCSLALLLSACGGGSGDDGNNANGPGNSGGSGVPPVTTVSENVATTDTATIQRSAAQGASNNVGTNINAMQRLGSNSSALDAILNNQALGSLVGSSEDTDATVFGDGTNDMLSDQGLDGDVSDLMNATLGLEGVNASAIRQGNLITIDPDDEVVCTAELVGEGGSQADLDFCKALVSDLIVTIEASTEDAGVVTYLFQGQPVLLIGYSPDSASFELKLAGLRTLLVRTEELSGESQDIPDTLEGAIMLGATATNTTPGAEAGSFNVSVTETLRIIDSNEGINFSLAPSTILEVVSDSAAGTASLAMSLGALQATFTDENDFGNQTLNMLSLAGFSIKADVMDDGGKLVISNLGLGNGPLLYSVDSVESLRVTLETFGFTVDDDGDRITLDGNLNFALALNNTMAFIGDTNSNFSLQLGVAAPGGTSLNARDNGSVLVGAGGPMTFSSTISDGVDNAQQSVSINQGQCFGENDGTNEALAGALVAPVDCGL